jgi:hypothetical protein
MTRRVGSVVLAVAVVLGLGSWAEATPFDLIGGTAGSIPGGASNEFIPGLFAGPQIGGYFGSQVMVNVPAGATLLMEFFGAEAGFHNEFNLFGEVFDHPGGTIIAPNLASPLGTYSLGIIGVGLLPFSFDVNNNAGSVVNSSNPDDSGGSAMGPNFFASCNPFGTSAGSGGRSCSTLYLFLDDGGAGPDDNHDDFLVRMTLTSVPEPTTIGLLGLGLLVLGRRRFNG